MQDIKTTNICLPLLYILQIDVIADLPVGQNLQNHYFAREPAYVLDKPVTFTEKEAMSLKTLLEYKLFGTGKYLYCKSVGR